MARTLTEIYKVAQDCKDQRLELKEVHNSSKMSVMNTFIWVVATCIWAFENILDVFKVDVARDLQNRVNGTPAYYVNALLKYQSGDSLQISEDGASFSYPTVDESKRVITKASYSEISKPNFHDKQLVLKVATGKVGAYEKINDKEMLAIREYANQISFAGTSLVVVSRKGDILIPRLTVYHDGSVSENEVYDNIERSLNNFVANLGFDGAIYTQRVIDAIQKSEHVVDVHVGQGQGVFVAQYDDDNHIIQQSDGSNRYEQKVDRYIVPNSGFVKQSSRSGEESQIPTWREAIILKTE